ADCTAAIRYVNASYLCERYSALIAQMPRNAKIVEPASEPIRLTARTGLSARSTSPPQTRRNRRPRSLIRRKAACPGGLPTLPGALSHAAAQDEQQRAGDTEHERRRPATRRRTELRAEEREV